MEYDTSSPRFYFCLRIFSISPIMHSLSLTREQFIIIL